MYMGVATLEYRLGRDDAHVQGSWDDFRIYIYIFFSLCIFSQVRNIPERIILISTTGLR